MFLWQAVQSSPELFFRPMDPSAQPVTPYCPSKRYLPPLSSCRRRVCSIIASFLALIAHFTHRGCHSPPTPATPPAMTDASQTQTLRPSP